MMWHGDERDVRDLSGGFGQKNKALRVSSSALDGRGEMWGCLEFPVMGVNFADACGEQQDASLEVFFVGGLDGLVDVAGRDRDRTSDGAAGDHALEVGGIGATCSEDFGLPLDLVLVGGFFHELDHAVVADDGGVHELDGYAFAEGGALFLWRGAGDIVGDGGIEAEAKVWLDSEGGGLGTTETDFLLHSEAGVEIEGGLALGFFQFAQCLDEEEYRGAVIE